MFRVSAPTDNLAKEYAGKMKELMVANEHVTMVKFDWMEKAPSVRVELDDDKLRQMGLTRKAVSAALYAEVSGYSISKYYEGDQAIDIVFRLEPKDHQDISDLGTMSIPTAKGAVQLNQVAYLSYENEDGMIWRRNLLPTVTVNAGIIDSVTGNDVTNEIWLASEEIRKNLPYGVTIEIDGSSEKSVKSLASILRPVPAMLIIMLILLMIMLMDIRKVLVVVSVAPLAIIGVNLGLFLFNTPMGILAQIGALALLGTVIRNGTVLVDQFDQNMAQGMTQLHAVKEAVIVRFRPIMLTALTTVLGLIPMFPSDFWRGMAISISCGLSVATLLTLVVLPVIYCMVFKVEDEDQERQDA
jgi:multidrug efflux pump